MAADIVPALYEQIEKDFDQRVKGYKKIQSFLQKKEKEQATGEDVSIYAADLGDCAAYVLLKNLTEGALPDGRMYYNIAERTVKPILIKVFDMVQAAAQEVTEYERKKKKIGLKPVTVDFPDDKVEDLMFKLVSVFESEAADE